jgi:gluconokinase
MIVLVMGVEGAGKSTVGRALAQELGWQFADGDDFHSPENKAKIHAGIPLTDEDRAPWLAAMHDQIVRWHQSGTNAVLAASALKESYRQQIFAGIPPEDYRIVFLHGPASVLKERVTKRAGHFASPAILESQLETLEPPQNAIAISITQPLAEQVKEIRSALHL